MIKIEKTKPSADYISLISGLQFRESDINAGVHFGIAGRELFKSLKLEPKFKDLKQQILEEQGYLCCYCNCRVQLLGSATEHILPISSHKHLFAEYKNLLISCDTSRISKRTDASYPLHCDASKKSDILSFTPLDNQCNYYFTYSITDGSILSNYPDGLDVIDKLQLDCTKLRTNRLSSTEMLYDSNGDFISTEEMELIWEGISKRDASNQYFPYMQAIQYFILEMI